MITKEELIIFFGSMITLLIVIICGAWSADRKAQRAADEKHWQCLHGKPELVCAKPISALTHSL